MPTPYWAAKKAEAAKDLETAAALYRLAIQRNDHPDSAVKDLASLLARKGAFDHAVNLIETHEHILEDKNGARNVLIDLYPKVGCYDKAAYLLQDRIAELEMNGGSDQSARRLRVIVRNLPVKMTGHGLRKMFKDYTCVTAQILCRLKGTPSKPPSAIGIMQFDSEEAARLVVKDGNNGAFRIHGRQLSCQYPTDADLEKWLCRENDAITEQRASLYYKLGDCLLAIGRKSEAASAFRKAASLNSSEKTWSRTSEAEGLLDENPEDGKENWEDGQGAFSPARNPFGVPPFLRAALNNLSLNQSPARPVVAASPAYGSCGGTVPSTPSRPERFPSDRFQQEQLDHYTIAAAAAAAAMQAAGLSFPDAQRDAGFSLFSPPKPASLPRTPMAPKVPLFVYTGNGHAANSAPASVAPSPHGSEHWAPASCHAAPMGGWQQSPAHQHAHPLSPPTMRAAHAHVSSSPFQPQGPQQLQYGFHPARAGFVYPGAPVSPPCSPDHDPMATPDQKLHARRRNGSFGHQHPPTVEKQPPPPSHYCDASGPVGLWPAPGTPQQARHRQQASKAAGATEQEQMEENALLQACFDASPELLDTPEPAPRVVTERSASMSSARSLCTEPSSGPSGTASPASSDEAPPEGGKCAMCTAPTEAGPRSLCCRACSLAQHAAALAAAN
eukprot:tig00001374_g8509.t1